MDVPMLLSQCPSKLQYEFPPAIDQKNTYTCVPICLVTVVDWYLNKKASSTNKPGGWDTCSHMLYEMRDVIDEHGMSCHDALDKLQRFGCWSSREYCTFRKQHIQKSCTTTNHKMSGSQWSAIHSVNSPIAKIAPSKTLRPTASQHPKIAVKSRRHALQRKSESGAQWQRTLISALVSSSRLCPKRLVRIHSYLRISTKDGVKVALTQIGPCLLVTPFYNTSHTFWKPSTRNFARYFRKMDQKSSAKTTGTALSAPRRDAAKEKVKQGADPSRQQLPPRFNERVKECEQAMELIPPPRRFHCTIVTGYNSTGFVARNSWSSAWSDNGCVTFPFDDVDKYATEIWCLAQPYLS